MLKNVEFLWANRGFTKVFNWGYRHGPYPVGLLSLQKREISMQHWKGQWCEETEGEDGFQQDKERGLDRVFPPGPQKESTLLTSWLGTSSLQKCGTIYFCCLSYPICDTELYQPNKLIHAFMYKTLYITPKGSKIPLLTT